MAHWLPVPTLLLSVTLGTNVNDKVNIKTVRSNQIKTKL